MRRVLIAAMVVAGVAGLGATPSLSEAPQKGFVFSMEPSAAQLYSVGSDGSGLRQITHVPGGVGTVSVSPNSTTIAFTTSVEAAVDGEAALTALAVGSSDGSWYRTVAQAGLISDLGWSSDGRWILYRAISGQVETLWLIRPDGSDARRVATGNPLDFDWSPDRRSLVLTDGKELLVYDVATGAERVVASYPDAGIGGPAWSPDSSRIAFVRVATGDVLVYDLETGSTDVIASYPPSEVDLRYGPGTPSWSPDSRRIAFAVGGFYGGEVHVIAADGGGDHVVDGVGRVYRLRWSPDGSHLAIPWESIGTGRHPGLDVARSDGTGAISIAFFVASCANAALWSPDGNEIAYGLDGGPLIAASADGVNPRTLVPATSESGGPCPVRWSRDGTLLFVSPDDLLAHPPSQLYEIDPATLVVHVLTEDELDHEQPAWSADGSRLAYVQVSEGRPQVVVTDAQGTNLMIVGRGTRPALSRDGSRVAFDRGGRILIGSIRGRKRVLARGGWPAWSPNGRVLAYVRRGAIWIARPNGRHKRRVLAQSDPKTPWGRPSWLGGGNQLYVPKGRGPSGVILNTNGAGLRSVHVPQQSADVVASDASPDGTQIAFESVSVEFGSEHDRIGVVPVSGGGPTVLVETIHSPLTGRLAPRLAWQP
jgi:Tol biopolymer transport system component